MFLRGKTNIFSASIRCSKNTRVLGMSASFCLSIIGILAIFPIIRISDSAEGATIPSTTTITMTIDHAQAEVDIIPTSSEGTFSSSTQAQEAEFAVITNNARGYNLSIYASDNDGELVNPTSGSTLDTISSAVDETTFSSISSTTYNGKWGIKPNKYNSSANTNYLPAPTTTASTLDVTNLPNSTANSYTIGLGVRADYSKPSGTYVNTFTIAAVGNPVPFQISYLDTTGDSSVAGLPSQETNSNADAAGFVVSTTTPTRDNYDFAGWCDSEVYHVEFDDSTCIGNVYTAGDDFYNLYSSNDTAMVNLYAMWNVKTFDLTVNFAGDGVSSVQVKDKYGLNGTSLGTVTTSGDSVSNLKYAHEYYIQPTFTDGYGISSWAKISGEGSFAPVSISDPTFTIGLGDATVTITGEQYCNTSVDGTMQDFRPCASIANQTAGSLTDSRDNRSYTVEKYTGYGQYFYMTQNLGIGCNGSTRTTVNLDKTNSNVSAPLIINSTNVADLGGDTYTAARMKCSSNSSYNAWYNYAAATADTIKVASTTVEAKYDICPKGWQIFNDHEAKILNTASGGIYSGGSNTNTGWGEWWTTTPEDGTKRVVYLYAGSYGVLSTTQDRGKGLYVRCVLKNSFYNNISLTSTMQELGALPVDQKDAITNAMSTNVEYNLRDSRDDQNYTVAKLADGKVWMIENLRLGLVGVSNDLTNENTNLSTTITATDFNSWMKGAGTSTDSAGEMVPAPGTDTDSGYPYGMLYNYYAASAGTISGSVNSNNTTSDLCPKGWRLPTSSEFSDLYSSYKSIYKIQATLADAGAGFILAGSFDNGSPTGQGSTGKGYYWSSTRRDDSSMYALRLSPAGPTYYSSARTSGISIRCVLDNSRSPSIEDITTMQEFRTLSALEKTYVVDSMEVNRTYTLRDSRDNQEYPIAKLADGNVWMTSNLNLGSASLTSSLTQENTNIITTVTASTFNGWKKTTSSGSYTAGQYIPITASNSATGSTTDSTSGTEYGVLYNFCAATGGTYCSSSSTNSGNSSQDICPAGWRLPAGGSSAVSETKALNDNTAYDTNAEMRSPVTSGGAAFALSGTFGTSGGPNSQGVSSRYWTSMRASNTQMYNLYLDASTVTVDNLGTRTIGASIRCILK